MERMRSDIVKQGNPPIACVDIFKNPIVWIEMKFTSHVSLLKYMARTFYWGAEKYIFL